MQTALIRDFKSGWIPSDDNVNGRKDGLLAMDNLELDRNGALSLIGGTQQLYSLGSSAYRLYSRYFGSSRYDYAALASGAVSRNGSNIISGGDTTETAFGTAFDFALICSNTQRKKDNIGTLYNLGINPPTAGPTSLILVPFYPDFLFSNMTATAYDVLGGGSGAAVGPDASGVSDGVWTGSIQVTQSSATDGSIPVSGVIQVTCTETDLSTLSNSSNFGTHGQLGNLFTENDVFQCLVTPNYVGSDTDWSYISSIEIDFLLDNPGGSSTPVNDYFSWVWTNPGWTGSSTRQISTTRDQFNQMGSNALGWQNCYGIRITFNFVAFFGAVLGGGFGQTNNGWAAASISIAANNYWTGGQYGSLNGIYQYAQQNIFNTGSYLASSVLGPVTTINTNGTLCGIVLTPQNPSSIDSSVNQVNLYRQGGALQQWYRVATITSSLGSAYFDNLSDQDAIDLDETINLNLISVAASSLTDKILAIVGPIEGRWFYFTTHFMYPSDINDPDLVDASLAVRTTGSNTEIFLWAHKINDSIVVVGTSVDIYILTGTFTTLPDNSIDIYYRSGAVKYPPITRDATVFNGTVYYLAADGWRLFTPSAFSMTYGGGANDLIVAPNTDRLYRGITCYLYIPPSLQIPPGSVRFPVVVGKNKVWCGIYNQNRIEVLDLKRNYWRPINYDGTLGNVTAMTFTQDGQIIACFDSDNILRIIDTEFGNLLIDGTTNQNITILTPTFDGPLQQPQPRNRKDLYTLKLRVYNGGQNVTVVIYDDTGTPYGLGSQPGGVSALVELAYDISQIITIPNKTFQIMITCTCAAFVLTDISVDYDARPTPVTFLRLYNSNFGSASKKRIRTWPHVIDTRGGNVLFTPIVDNVPLNTQTQLFNSSDKTTMFYFFTSDAFGVDYGATLLDQSGGEFEYWEGLPPDIVQVLPIARRLDQIGPEELFQYGRISKFELRVLPFGTVIPITFYFDDSSETTINLSVTNGVEATYVIGAPKTLGGNIVRIVLGPTLFNFHRYYMRLLVQRSGTDSDNEWITIPSSQNA